jgi:hypothetical protein
MQCNEPDGPFYFAGEHLSHIGARQEGAIVSARRAINMIDKHRHTACVMVRCQPMITALPDDGPRVPRRLMTRRLLLRVPRRVAYFAFAVRLLKSTSVAAAR